MAEIENVKQMYEQEGKSLREIARETGMTFRTVRKYAYQEDWNERRQPGIDAQKYPVLGPYIPKIDEWLEQDMLEPRKHHHTIKRVYDRLCEEAGYKGSYSCIR